MNPREQMQMKDTLAYLQARGDLFTRQLMNEKQRVKTLEAKLRQVNEEITKIREGNKKKAVSLLNMHSTTANDAYRRADGLDPTRLADINQKKLVQNLESRLNKALVRKNQIQNENNAIKSKIDKLRRKVSNDNVNRCCMEKKIKNIQEEMDVIMEKAAIASEQRDKLMEQKNQITHENIDEQKSFAVEYQKLNAFITEQAGLLENSIAALASDVTNKTLIEVNEGENKTNGKSSVEELEALDKKIKDHESLCENSEQVLQQTDEKIQMYEKNFKQLQEVSGLVSTDDIISAFVKNEEESFSLFNYIQTVNQETDSTLEQHSRLEQEMKSYTQDQMDKENQRVSIVNGYKESLQEAHDERAKMTDMAREGKKTIEKIAKKVQTLYHTLHCEDLENRQSNQVKDNLKQLLPRLSSYNEITELSGEEISERNILRSMELIEKRSMQIINEYAKQLIASRKNSRRPSVLMVRFMILVFVRYYQSILHVSLFSFTLICFLVTEDL